MQQVKFNIIDDNNLSLLQKFINLNKSTFFRYYSNKFSIKSPSKQPCEAILCALIANHILTVVLTINDTIIGYAHLDRDLNETTAQGFGIVTRQQRTRERERSSASRQERVAPHLVRPADSDLHKIWFGIYVLEDYQSQGYGKKILNYIFNYCKLNQIEKIHLSVDKDNKKAITLYQRNNFVIESEGSHNFFMNKTF